MKNLSYFLTSFESGVIMSKRVDCPYLIDCSQGYNKIGNCTITKDICGYIRYCTTVKHIVSSELYFLKGCNIKNKYEESVEDNG